MATRQQFEMTESERRARQFSDAFKRSKVRELELKKVRVSEICRQYQVSAQAVNGWRKKYGTQYVKQEKLIVEAQSDTRRIEALQKQVAELERALGQKQLQLDFASKMIDIAEVHYAIDIKKKFGS